MSDSNFEIPVAKTSLWIAGERYRESQRSDKVIDDPYAEILLGQSGKKMLENMKKLFSTSILHTRAMALRAKWVEDLMQKAVANGITQIVNPACGLDTYAWRINLPSHVSYYELDFPEIMEYKAKQLADANVLCNYKPIAIDLRDESWPDKLIESGFDKTKKTMWITMGFLLYVPEDGVHMFLDRVNKLSAPGSWYTSDLCKFVKEDPEGCAFFMKVLKENGSPVEFLTDDPKGLFEPHGFSKLISYLTYYEYSKELGVEFSEDDSKLKGQQKHCASLVLVEK